MIFERERFIGLVSPAFLRSTLAIGALCSTLACSDKSLVSKATAAHVYWEDRYEKNCVAAKGDPTKCHACQAVLNDARETVMLANRVYQIGPMPKEEKAEVKVIPASFTKECP